MQNFWNKIKLIWTDTILRKRVLFVFFALVVFRLLSAIPIPGIDTLERKRFSSNVSMPGIGIAESNLKTTKAKNTNKTLFRRIVSVQISFILFQKFCIIYLITICLPLIPKRFLISENVSIFPSLEIILSLFSLNGFFLDLN